MLENIDYKNAYMFKIGRDLTCKLCSHTVARDKSCSWLGVNCICDSCRIEMGMILNIPAYDLIKQIQESAKIMLKGNEYLVTQYKEGETHARLYNETDPKSVL